MTTTTTTTTPLSLPPSDFRDDEIQAADALLALLLPQSKPTTSFESRHRPVTGRFPRWGTTRRRSVLKTGQENQPSVERLSPSTPLSFSPSGGEETPSPPPPLPPRPPPAAKIFKNKEQHKEWVKEQSKRIATLSATKATLQQCVLEAKSRYQTLRETNSWLKELQLKLRETREQQRRRQLLYESQRSSKSELDLFPVGPACSVGYHQRWRQLDPNQGTAEEKAAEWRRQQRASAYAQARKRRIELQRVKSSLKIQRLR